MSSPSPPSPGRRAARSGDNRPRPGGGLARGFPYHGSINTSRSHVWVDRRSLALAQATAAKIARHPELFHVARENLRRWKATLGFWHADLREWERILAEGVEVALARLTEDSPRGRRLRQSSPFPGVLTPQERQAIFDEYESIPA